MQGVIDWLEGLVQWVADLVLGVVDWVVEETKQIAAWLLDQVLSAVAGLLEAIPVPAAFGSISGAWSDAISAAGFVLAPWHIGPGLTMVFGALALRWLIRRIPIVG
jgi:hypothetical protein